MHRNIIPAAIDVLKTSRSFREGIERIRCELGVEVNSKHLSTTFKRAGFNAPGSYVGLEIGSRPRVELDPPTIPSGIPTPRETPPAPVFSRPGSLERVLIVPDVHVPYHDELAWRTVLAVARGWRPDACVILGDFGDFYQVSQHPKDPSRRISFGDEIKFVLAELERFAKLGIPRVIFCEGNHETRFQRLVNAQSPVLHGVTGIASDARQLLDVAGRFGWEWVPYGHHASIGKLSFMHDAGHCGVYAARQSVTSFGASIVFGHTHRAGAHYESTVGGDRHVGWTMGWLGDPEAIDYRHRARVLRESQHGFGIAHIEQGSGLFWCGFVPVISGRAVVDGVMFDGRSFEVGS